MAVVLSWASLRQQIWCLILADISCKIDFAEGPPIGSMQWIWNHSHDGPHPTAHLRTTFLLV